MKIFAVLFIAFTAQAVEFQINNNRADTIWIGIQGSSGNTHLEEGGFVLRPFGQRLVNAPANWTGMVWARTECNHNTKLCQTGSCGRKIHCSGATPTAPVTIVDIALKSRKDGMDAYGVSLVDGFNVPAKIEPMSRLGDCMSSHCLFDINSRCHEELSVMSETGEVIGCQSACGRYFSPCCRNKFKLTQNCTDKVWPVDSTPYFKQHCPEAKDFVTAELNKEFVCSSQVYTISFGEKN